MSFPGETSDDAEETLPETSKKENYAGSVEEDAGKEGIGEVNSSKRKRCTLDPCKEEDEDEARKKKTKKKKKRCAYDPCKTKLGLTAYPCRCARCGMWVDVGWINIIICTGGEDQDDDDGSDDDDDHDGDGQGLLLLAHPSRGARLRL